MFKSIDRTVVVPLITACWLLGQMAAPVLAADAPPGPEADRLCKIERQLDDLRIQLEKLRDMMDRLTAINNVQTQANTRDITALKQDMERLQALTQRIDKLEKDLARAQSESPRISLYPPTTTTMGQLELVNAWFDPVHIVVDGLSYVLQPGERRLVSKAAGNFSYEVLGIEARRIRTVTAGQTFTIRVGPR